VTSQANPHSLIIGGTRGMGRALAELFAREQHTVSVIGRQIPPEPITGKVHFWSVDLLERQELSKTLDDVIVRHGNLNNLIFLQRFKGKGDKWEGEIQTSLSATKFVIDALIDQFHDASDKSIVIVSSAASDVVAEEQDAAYHVAKAGLNQLARYYAVVLGPKGFRVNVVSPGTVLKKENQEYYLGNDKLQKLVGRTVPLGRMGTALEVAHVISFLCSPKASFLTGQTILVDGGANLVSCETLARKLADLKF
jgi:NAD(P)-dependent dehydrogenase (short-subunit alcohol dehydrogenase family)